jgi:hypothetical protein
MTTRKQLAAKHGLSRYAIDRIRKSSESRQVLARSLRHQPLRGRQDQEGLARTAGSAAGRASEPRCQPSKQKARVCGPFE